MPDTTNPQAERRTRYAAAMDAVTGGSCPTDLIDAVMAVADAEQAAVSAAASSAPADRAAILTEAIARVEDPEERAKTTTGLGLGWEAARDVLRCMADEAQQPEAPVHGESVAHLAGVHDETQQPETGAPYPPETFWQIETRWHDGAWRSWAVRTDHDEALDEFGRAKDGKHAWRLVQFHTTSAIEAQHTPAAVSQPDKEA